MSRRAHSGGASLWDALDIFDWFDGLFEHPARGTEVVR